MSDEGMAAFGCDIGEQHERARVVAIIERRIAEYTIKWGVDGGDRLWWSARISELRDLLSEVKEDHGEKEN